MKKNKLKIAVMMLGILIFSLIGATFVHAGENDSAFAKHQYEGIYAAYDGPTRIHLFYAQRYTLNGVTAYCIEPAVKITTDVYSSTTDFGVTGYSSEVMRYLRLVAYYAYDYPGHDHINYYFAGQELMWEKIYF